MHAIRTALTLLLVVVLAACGDAEPEPAETTPSATVASPTPPGPTPCATPNTEGPVELCGRVKGGSRADLTEQGDSVELTVTVSGGVSFDPTYIKTAPGADVAVTVVNTAAPSDFSKTHSFTIRELGVAAVVDLGERATVRFTLPHDARSVVFVCTIGDHLAAGMQGAFHFG